jgi:hypothetical protein
MDVDEAIEKRNELQERIHFVPWMYVEPGRIYFEHGNQYDEYCSFDHWLLPGEPAEPAAHRHALSRPSRCATS